MKKYRIHWHISKRFLLPLTKVQRDFSLIFNLLELLEINLTIMVGRSMTWYLGVLTPRAVHTEPPAMDDTGSHGVFQS